MPTQSKRKRILPVILAVTFVLAVTVATVYAYLSASTNTVSNSFSADVDPDITIAESFNPDTDNVKTDVAVQVGKTGYTVYVRAAIVVTWKDASGNVLATKPVSPTDYTITLNDTNWFLHTDGYYYCKSPVQSGNATPVLITTCAPVEGKTPAGYGLNVEIIAQAVQAKGTTDVGGTPAVTDAWGVTIDSNGYLTP
ncbi:MAG: hypothetical protein E7651_00515 [Ruminococcaceae bacterium]|nr:hypothetical protein [Oscillospiraceae bacterium]